jgi:hypothetical protein
VDDTVELPSGYVPGEVDHHEQWRRPHPYRTYAELLGRGGGIEPGLLACRTPTTRLVRADADHEPDLFWAVRGGGGSVGVVTAIEMMLYPVPELYAGALFFPIERTAEVLHTWRQWTDTVPDEVTSIGRILRLPSSPRSPSSCAAGPGRWWKPPASAAPSSAPS